MAVADIWYDIHDPDSLHRDLLADYPAVQAVLATRPALAKAHADCRVCAAIARDVRSVPAPATGQRVKLRISKDRMRQLLHLPETYEIVHMWADNDPNAVSVIVAGGALPAMTDGDVELPLTTPQDLAVITAAEEPNIAAA